MLRIVLLLSFSFLLICLSAIDVDAQKRSRNKKVKHRFNAGAIVGFNLSQIDGDLYTGFDKLGIRLGLKGEIYVNDRLDIVVGLLYNQKGARFENVSKSSIIKKNRVIHFDYMEVPFLISFKTQKDRDYGYYLETGFSYARLINHRVKESNFDPSQAISYSSLAKDFNSNEFNFLLGVNYFFNAHLGVGVMYTLQMNKAYDRNFPEGVTEENNPAVEIPFLRNYQLGLQVIYNIF